MCVSVAAKSGAESECLVAPVQQPCVGRVFVRNPSPNPALQRTGGQRGFVRLCCKQRVVVPPPAGETSNP